MKRKGRHPDKALTAVLVRQTKQPGRHADGNGLYLEVDESGAKRWVLRIVVQGRRRDIGLGSATLVPLGEAREKALAFRKAAREGGDPLAERQKAGVVIPTFQLAAERVHADRLPTWKNEKYARQWLSALERYAYPELGKLPIDAIGTPQLLRVLSPIWLNRADTAQKVLQQLRTIFDWAKAAGYRQGDNPVDGVRRGLPKQPAKQAHHAALPYADVPAFVSELRREQKGGLPARLAFEFLILTAARTSEVLNATWDEIDLKNNIWVVPAKRMKAGQEHRVPLSARPVEILSEMRKLAMGDYVFPGTKPGKPLTNMVFQMALRRRQIKITPHGFRSAFRDWASETTSHPSDVCEMALAHTIKSKVEAAYRRGDLFQKRRALMDDWASFVSAGGECREGENEC